jgi:hypothetical protein
LQHEDCSRIDRRLARGLEDVSHLFFSQPSDRPAEQAERPQPSTMQPPSGTVPLNTPMVLRAFAPVHREVLISLLRHKADALEEGLRSIDANVPCAPFGFMDVLALGSRNQITVIDVETLQNDVSILRGIAGVEWIFRNRLIVGRMYSGQSIDFSIPPRLFLVAPGFSPLLKCVAQQNMIPKIACFRYHSVEVSGSVGILFECT